MVILPDTAFHLIDRDKLFYGVLRFNEAGTRLAYVASVDSAESRRRRSSLFMTDLTADLLSADEISLSIPQESKASYEASRQTPRLRRGSKKSGRRE